MKDAASQSINPASALNNIASIKKHTYLASRYEVSAVLKKSLAPHFIISLPGALINEVGFNDEGAIIKSFDAHALENLSENRNKDLLGTVSNYIRLGIKILGTDPQYLQRTLGLKFMSIYLSKEIRKNPQKFQQITHPVNAMSLAVIASMMGEASELMALQQKLMEKQKLLANNSNSMDIEEMDNVSRDLESLEIEHATEVLSIYVQAAEPYREFIHKLASLSNFLSLPPSEVFAALKEVVPEGIEGKEKEAYVFNMLQQGDLEGAYRNAEAVFVNMAKNSHMAPQSIGESLQHDLAAMAFSTAAATSDFFIHCLYEQCAYKERYTTPHAYLKTLLPSEELADFYLSQTQAYMWAAQHIGPQEGKVSFLKKALKNLWPTHDIIASGIFGTHDDTKAFNDKIQGKTHHINLSQKTYAKKYNALKASIQRSLKNKQELTYRSITDFSFGGTIEYNKVLPW
jgi:hypothetical protein